jgi:hypothetical protein
MGFEKRLFVTLSIVIGLIVIVSLSDGFTGFAVKDYDNYLEYESVIPGNTIKGEIIINLEGEGIVKEIIEVEGEAKEWVVLDDTEYVFVPSVQNKIPYKIVVPEYAEEGSYNLRFSVISVQDFEKTSILSSQVVSNIDIILNVGGEESNDFMINSFDLYDVEEGEYLDFSLRIENNGNVEEDTAIQIIINDAEGNYVTEKNFNGLIYAYENQELTYGFDYDLEEGEYLAEVYVGIGDMRKKTTDSFNVVNKGELSKKAQSLGTGVYVKDNSIYVTTIVENTGESVLDSYLSGKVGDNYFESDSARILPGSYEIFEYHYSDVGKAGDYVLETEVYHNNVVLGHQETNFYVSDEGVVSLEMSFLTILVFIILALVVSHYVLTKRLKKNE